MYIRHIPITLLHIATCLKVYGYLREKNIVHLGGGGDIAWSTLFSKRVFKLLSVYVHQNEAA